MSAANLQLSTVFARLRFIRSMSGLTRDEMAEKYAIPEITLRRWETGSVPLSKKGLQRCLNAYKQEGIIATETWLMSGQGGKPFLEVDCGVHQDQGPALEYFQKALNNCVVFKINDNSMMPKYSMNEIVVADVFIGDLAKLHNSDCIIMLEDETIFLRKLIYSDENNISFICTNPLGTNKAALHNVKVKYIAPVIWHQISN